MQLDLVEWIAYEEDTSGAGSRAGSASLPAEAEARVHNEHSQSASPSSGPASCVQSEHNADARPKRPMSAYRLLICLAVLGWSERDLARRTGRHQTTVNRWASGSSAVDDYTADWLELLVAFHIAHPAPRRSRTGRVNASENGTPAALQG